MAKGLRLALPQHSHGCGSAHDGPEIGRSSPCNQYWLLNKVITALVLGGGWQVLSTAILGVVLGPHLHERISGPQGLRAWRVAAAQFFLFPLQKYTTHNELLPEASQAPEALKATHKGPRLPKKLPKLRQASQALPAPPNGRHVSVVVVARVARGISPSG